LNFLLDVSIKPLFIGVTGGTAGGKTTVCDIISKEFESMCSIVTFDNFYKGLTKEEHDDADNYNFDSPNALDFDLCYSKLVELLQYKDIEIPVYDFTTHSRVENESLKVKA
jgi:uridine kinase